MKKERFVDWWKQDKRYMTLLKAVLMALLPLLCCLVRTAAEGRSIGQVYLPSSEWNDELFYFKQVEGIVNYGFPRGYFGFNESHALQLSFAAWSPVLVFPWILWGLLFGWNLLSPVICNIVLLTITMFAFVWLVIEVHFALSLIAMLFAHLLMYKMVEGSKHFLTFIAAGIFIVSMLETRYYKKAVLLGAAFLYLYSFKAVEPYDYQIPYVTEERQAQVEYWREIFSEKLAMDTEQVPNYENVVIWTFGDETPEGHQNLKWQLLYSAPKGFGISCCEREYITEHLTELQSRYLATVSGGAIDEMCRTAGYEELGRDADMVLYRRY